MKQVFLVEDDREIAKNLALLLRAEGFSVIHAKTKGEAEEKIGGQRFDLALVDISLPDGNGYAVCTRIKEAQDIPVIFLTASGDEASVVTGLNMGADDYITKPFSVTEMAARIKANIRRNTQYAAGASMQRPVLIKGTLTMNLNDYSVKKDGKEIELTAKEFEILKLLLQNPKKVYTKEQLYSLVWNDAYLGDENAVNVHISRLRTKIEDDPRNPGYIVTVWGIGYKAGDL